MCTTMCLRRPASRVIPSILRLLSVHTAAISVDLVNQHWHCFWWCETRDTVAEIEHVPAGANGAEVIDNLAGLRANAGFRSEQNHGVEVALQRHAVVNALAGLAQAGCPVQSHRVTTRGS